jgi:hypothetical protein
MNSDSSIVDAMIGKYVLVGVNRCSQNGTVISTEQVHGKILRITDDEGLVISTADSNEFSLPPLLGCYQSAEEGTYTLESTGEQIVNPDYIATFNVTATQDDE